VDNNHELNNNAEAAAKEDRPVQKGETRQWRVGTFGFVLI
jgi:hypothetical protein